MFAAYQGTGILAKAHVVQWVTTMVDTCAHKQVVGIGALHGWEEHSCVSVGDVTRGVMSLG